MYVHAVLSGSPHRGRKRFSASQFLGPIVHHTVLRRTWRKSLIPTRGSILHRASGRMPIRLPGEAEEGAGVLSQEEVNGLVTAASRILPGPSFGALWGELLSRQPTLKQNSEMLPQRPLSSLAGVKPVQFLYVMQREWAVVPPPSMGGPDYIASDDATTCHIIGAFHRGTGMCGLCHLDDTSRLGDLRAFEDAIMTPPSSSPSSHSPSPCASSEVDLYIVGGFQERQSEELTAAVLEYFHRSVYPYTLRVATVSVTNTTPTPTGPSPICRAFGLRLADGAIFTGPLPVHLRGPARGLRSARVFADHPQPMTRLIYDTALARVAVAPFPFSAATWQRRLLRMDDDSLLHHTSTSPLVEGPSFVPEMRETLSLLHGSTVVDHFPVVATKGGKKALAPAWFDVPLVSLHEARGGLGEMKGEVVVMMLREEEGSEGRKKLRKADEQPRWPATAGENVPV